MKVYAAQFNAGYVGGTATVIANSEEEARDLIIAEMRANESTFNFVPESISLTKISQAKPIAVILSDGDY